MARERTRDGRRETRATAQGSTAREAQVRALDAWESWCVMREQLGDQTLAAEETALLVAFGKRVAPPRLTAPMGMALKVAASGRCPIGSIHRAQEKALIRRGLLESTGDWLILTPAGRAALAATSNR